jgi:hypothetical protein
MTKICLILAMLRQAGQVNTAKNMKFREMVNTADYQVSPLFFFPTLRRRTGLCVPRNQTARPLSQFLRPRSFLSGKIFFPILGTVYLQCIQLYIFHHNKLRVCGYGRLDVSRDGNRPVAYSTLHCTKNPIYVFPQKRNARPQCQFLYMCL